MAVFRYEGPWDARDVWGVSFQLGQTHEIDDEKLIAKLSALEGFVRVDAIEAEPSLDPDPNDYPADEEQSPEEVFEELKIPRVGAGTIPEDWETLHHSTRIRMAKEMRPDLAEVITTAADADEVIRGELTPE